MLKVGLTGGIGSGKSTVAAIFKLLGIPVFDADQEAKRLMNDDPALKQKVIDLFGNAAYKNGALDRKYIADIVFNDAEKLEQLNTTVHPVTISATLKWMTQQTSAYTIKEAALLFESSAATSLDYIIGVSAPEPLRIQRAMKRDGINKEAVSARIQKQMAEATKMGLCDFIIVNDEHELLIPQVINLHNKLMKLANQ